MKPFRYRDEEPLSHSILYVLGGALAGFGAGVLLAHRMGGITGIATRFRDRFRTDGADIALDNEGEFDVDEFEEGFDEIGIGAAGGAGRAGRASASAEDIGPEARELEERVLHAYHNDPILSERSVDIGAISDGIVELTGWVNTEEEAAHAVTLARGVPGVQTVVNRLAVRPREDQFDDFAERYANGDPALTESHWEGQSVGTGRRRQGNSSEPDRHADPRPHLAERWTREEAAIADAADDIGDSGRREPAAKRGRRGGRTDGSAVAPNGVPKGDHVAEPSNAAPPPEPPRAD